MANLTTQNLAIAKLYTALFNRAPDADGFAFWTQALANGASLDSLAQSMLTAPEAVAIYPAGQTSEQFVTAYYTSVFGRAPDAEGLAFWSAALAAQGGAGNPAARAALTTQISTIASTPLTGKPDGMSDAAYAQTVADRARFINKTEFGVYFATELKSKDLTLAKSSFALVTDNASSVTAATNLAAGTATAPAPSAPEPVLTITATDSATDIATKFTAYSYSSAKVDATGMDTGQLSAVAAAVNKIAVNGITGTFALSNTQTLDELKALVGTKTAAAATVSVNATSMYYDKMVALGLGAAKIDALTNLPTLALSFAWDDTGPVLTAEILAGLFSIAPAAGLRFNNGAYATGAQVDVIAANLGKVAALLGGIGINREVSVAGIDLLTSARAGGSLIASVRVTSGGMNAEQIAAVVRGVAGVSSLEIDNATSADVIATLLAAPGIGATSVSVYGYEMTDPAQVAAVGRGAANVDSLDYVNNLVLKLGDPAMSDAATVGILSLITRVAGGFFGESNTARVNADGASAVELAALVTYNQAIVDGGITGTLNLDQSFSAIQLGALLGAKTAAAATVHLDVSGMSAEQLSAVAAGAAKVDVIDGLALVFPAAIDTTKLAALLSKAGDATVAVVGTGASAGELTVLAANLGKIATTGVTGTLLLTKDLSASVLTSLLGAVATASSTIDVDAAGMSVGQLQAVAAGAGRVHSLVNQPLIVLADLTGNDAALADLLAVAADGSLRVQAEGAAASQLAILANAQAKLATDGITGTFTLSSSLSDTQIAALLRAKTDVAATANVDASGMSSAQLAAMYQGLAKLGVFANIPTLKLGDAAMTVAVIAWLVSLAPSQSMAIDATGASMAKINTVAGSYGEKIAPNGITGSFNVAADLRTDLVSPLFMFKVADAANVQVDATGMNLSQLVDLGLMASKIDGMVGVTIPLAAFVSGGWTQYVAPLVVAANPASVKVDVSGVNWSWVQSLVLSNLTKIMDGGVIGTFTIPSTATAEQLSSLLSTKTAADAVVTVQAGAASDLKLNALLGVLPSITSISGLELHLAATTVDRDGLGTLLAKAALAQVWTDAATASDIDLVLGQLSHIGSFRDTLKLSAAQFSTLSLASLDSKLLSSTIALQITGDASNDVIDLAGMSKNVRIEGGAGADTITAGGGADQVYIGSAADTRVLSFSADATTAQGNIDVITLGLGDVLKFTTAMNAFIPGLALTGGGIASRSVASAGTFQEIFTALNDMAGLRGSSNTYTEFIRVSVGDGSLAGNYLILNDQSGTIDINDMIIGLTLNGRTAQDTSWLSY